MAPLRAGHNAPKPPATIGRLDEATPSCPIPQLPTTVVSPVGAIPSPMLEYTSPASDHGPNFFPNANNFTIPNMTINNNSGTGPKTVFEHLEPYVCHGAAHNSQERRDAPKCHEETRLAVRHRIFSWIKREHGDEAPKQMIMWLSGPAGAGKTAIAGTIAEEYKSLVAATFFFSSFYGSADRRSKRCVITTITRQLAEHGALPSYKAQLLESIESNPSIYHKHLKEQAECLLLGPFRKLRNGCDTTNWPMVIIIDGLDEVESRQPHGLSKRKVDEENHNDQIEILSVLSNLAKDPDFPFCILISSRPERIIESFFRNLPQNSILSIFLDNKYDPDADIKLFLRSKFAEIQQRFRIPLTDNPWPGQEAINHIVDISSGQFIVPTTVIRWVASGIPREQLKVVMQLERLHAQKENPFAVLDELYGQILERSHNPMLMAKWIVCITSDVFHSRPPTPPPTWFWRQLFEDVDGEFDYHMGTVASLISVPPPEDTSSPITVYHKSLTDFLSSTRRCGDLYINQDMFNSFVASRIAKILKNGGPAAAGASVPPDSNFLRTFLNLELLVAPTAPADGPIYTYSSKFLRSLGQTSKDELVSCDVRRCTEVFLTRDAVVGVDGFGRAKLLLGGIYCGIHRTMECNSSVPSSAQLTTQKACNPPCHAACVLWRKDILATAKEMGWCVHQLEDVEVDQLEHVTLWEFWQYFREMGQRQRDGSVSMCGICHELPPDAQ